MSKFLNNKGKFLEFLKFLIVGCLNAIIQLTVYYFFLYLGFNYNISYAIGFIFSVLNAYIFNKKFVFRLESINTKVTLFKIYLTYGFTFLLSQLLLYVGIEKLEILDKIMPIINITIMTPLNYLLNRFFVFSGDM